MKRPARELVRYLQSRGLTLALAESMTCGLASYHLGMVKGTMDVFKGSIVCYTPEIKADLLGVRKRLIRKFTPESQQVTDAMARQLAKLIRADIHAAITGLSAKGGSESAEKPVGTVFFSVRSGNRTRAQKKIFRGTRKEIEAKACHALYAFIRSVAKKQISRQDLFHHPGRW